MTIHDQTVILKACKICGLKAWPARSIHRDIRFVEIEGGDGYGIPFNPLHNIADAMELLIFVGGTISIDNNNKTCSVLIAGSDAVTNGGWIARPKNRTKNICKAIVNAIIAKGAIKC